MSERDLYPNDRMLFLGFGLPIDGGPIADPALAAAPDGTLVLAWRRSSDDTLHCRIGTPARTTIDWSSPVPIDTENRYADLSCAMSDSGVILVVSQDPYTYQLRILLGRLTGAAIAWQVHGFATPNHKTPCVAFAGKTLFIVASAAVSGSRLYWNIAECRDFGNYISFQWAHKEPVKYDTGVRPRIACDQNYVVEVHTSENFAGDMWMNLGRVEGTEIKWLNKWRMPEPGFNPTVAITAGRVILVYQAPADDDGHMIASSDLMQRIGFIKSNEVSWDEPLWIDDSSQAPAIAQFDINKVALASRDPGWGAAAKYSFAQITSHANWMRDLIESTQRFGDRSLRQIVLPGSHDAGMVGNRWVPFLFAQDVSVLEQLRYGIRYFDFRPKWIGLDEQDFFIHHGGWACETKVRDVLGDIRRFFQQSASIMELVLIKISHFEIGDRHPALMALISEILGPWLYTKRPVGQRLAEVPIGQILATGPKVLVLYDNAAAQGKQTAGFWFYRDWSDEGSQDSPPAIEGDIVVFDEYSNSTNPGVMIREQAEWFKRFDGHCKNQPTWPCDLFLLSWTLTPELNIKRDFWVWPLARKVNPELGDALAHLLAPIPNQFGLIPNILFVDFIQYARVTDIAIWQNQR